MLRIFTIIYLEEICAGGDLRWLPIEFVHSTSELTIFYGTKMFSSYVIERDIDITCFIDLKRNTTSWIKRIRGGL